MIGSADTVAGHSRLPRSARGSPGAATAEPAIRNTPAAARSALIDRLRDRRPQTRCQRLLGSALILAPSAPVFQPSRDVGFQPAIGGAVIATTAERLGQMFLIDARFRRV